MTSELPELAYVKGWLVTESFTDEWLQKFWDDNILITGIRDAALNHSFFLKEFLKETGRSLAPEYNSIQSTIKWLNGLAAGMYDLRNRYDKRHQQVEEEMLVAISEMHKERMALRKLYEPLIEQTHEAQERAEYYRSLLDDHHIEY